MIDLDYSYARDLPGTYVDWKPVPVAAARLLFFNRPLAQALGLDAAALVGPAGLDLFAGNAVPDGGRPIAQAYAGHQFGGFSAQLGDGRAVLLGEVLDPSGQRHDLALKGSGRTPFSRGGDGRAAVGPMLREALISEAMNALGVPTTRALAVVATGEPVYRDRVLPGAVLTRVAASHLRVGTFQYFAARGDHEKLRQVADYTIARHYPALRERPSRYLDLLAAVARRQAALIARWMNLGFIHGVMNTDNMALSGETIDYGPCAFMEAFDPDTVFSSIDDRGRYAWSNQPGVARWNLARFAETLLPLIAEGDDETAIQRAADKALAVIDAFPAWYTTALRIGQRDKLGLADPATRASALDWVNDIDLAVTDLAPQADALATLADDWLALLQAQAVDYTLAWRRLADVATAPVPTVNRPTVDSAVADGAASPGAAVSPLHALFSATAALDDWLQRWQELGNAGPRPDGSEAVDRRQQMRQVNPLTIPRNHLTEEALAAASDRDDLGPFEAMLAAVRQPFDEVDSIYIQPAPADVTASYQTFCGT